MLTLRRITLLFCLVIFTQGAFAEVSGLDSETEVIESQTDPAVLAIKT